MSNPFEVPEPILFNNWKHHAGAIRYHLQLVQQEGESALSNLAEELKRVGASLMDLYLGELTPCEIAESLLARMKEQRVLERPHFESWLRREGEYAMLTLEDESCWVLRLADEQERYVHVHPGRWTPLSIRVRANALKTAILTLAHVGISGGDPFDLSIVNSLRVEHLDLSPIGKALDPSEGLGELIGRLDQSEASSRLL